MEKVLVSYHFGPQAIPLGEQISRAFERAGMTVLRFDSGVPRSAWDRPKRLIKSLSKLLGQKKRLARYWERRNELATARRFAAAARAFRPDLMLVLRGEPVEPAVVAELKRELSAKAILWWVKTTRWQNLMERDAQAFDASFTIHRRLATGGIRHLPAFALDSERYFAPTEREERWPVLFVGCWSERRQRYLEAIADLPLAVIGPNWRKRLAAGHPLRQALAGDWVADTELADCYRQARIVVDIGQIERRPDEGETMRVADVPACGAVLMTEASDTLSTFFRLGSVAVFATPEELRKQLQALLADPQAGRQMAAQAAVDVQKLPTFDQKVVELLQFAGQEREDMNKHDE